MKHRHLEVFRAVMRAGSITGAAHLLGLTQPGASKLIAQGEELCGFPLFSRVQNRLVPTERAVRLFEEAERLFVGMEEINRLVGRLRSDGPPRTVVAAIPMIAQEILPFAAADWLAGVDAQLFVTTRDAGGVLAMVTSRNADVGFAMSFRRTPGVRSQLIARSRVMCAISTEHPLAAKAIINPTDLQGERFISISRHEGQQQKIDQVLAAASVKPKEVAEMPLIIGAAAMARAGIGITFADCFSARPWLGQGLVLRPFEPEIRFEYHAIWIDGAPQGRNVQTLIAAMRATMRAQLQSFGSGA
ncbi:LysR substrate-binding domain-containing protein [Bosea robiniae]|nr:LysR substrate-binding domain-containing protein [Bosea robiniae]